MTHMGYYAHEFGHLMGAHHTSLSKHWSLMDTGMKAGTKLANRPASMNPWFLYKSGWANLNFVASDCTGVELAYNTSPDTFSTYNIRKIPNTQECLLVENRQYDNTYDKSLPGATQGLSGGILIWNILNDGLNLGETDLLEADKDETESQANMAQDVFRPSVYTSGKINDATTPANLNRRNGAYSRFAISNYFGTNNPLTVDFDINFVAPPTNLQITNATSNGANPVLQWTHSVDPDRDHYLVYRGFTPDWKTTPVTWESSPAANLTNRTWVDHQTVIDLSKLSATYYRVTTVDGGANESEPSDEVWTTSSPAFLQEREELTAGLGLSATKLPHAFALQQNYPNPFNPETEIRYELSEAAKVNIKIYNLLGEEISVLARGTQTAGFHSVAWDGEDAGGNAVPSGVYVYLMEASTLGATAKRVLQVKKMTLLR